MTALGKPPAGKLVAEPCAWSNEGSSKRDARKRTCSGIGMGRCPGALRVPCGSRKACCTWLARFSRLSAKFSPRPAAQVDYAKCSLARRISIHNLAELPNLLIRGRGEMFTRGVVRTVRSGRYRRYCPASGPCPAPREGFSMDRDMIKS